MFLENIRLALHSLGANKLRTFLTMLGIMIGVGAVVAIETIGAGQTKQMEEQFAGNGVNNIQIYMWSENYDEDAPQLSFTQDMMKKFVNKFGDHIEAIEMDAYGNSGKAYLDAAKQDETYANFYQQGVNNGAFTVENVKLKEGRTFTGDELNNASNAAVVSDKFVDNMWGGDYAGAIGRSFTADFGNDQTASYTVVGVYTYQIDAQSLRSMDQKDIKSMSTPMFVPYKNVTQSPYLDLSGYPDGYDPFAISYFTLQAKQGEDVVQLATSMQDYMQSMFSADQNVTVESFSNKQMVDEVKASMQQQTTTISLIAAIALLVGGIGVMNIMTVTITERTREIGTRKAMGAKRRAIRQQFIIEAVVMCVIGGMIGTIGGLIGGIIGCRLMHYSIAVPMDSIALAIAVSLAIGIFFGYYPANRAAKMDPIEALRYE